MSEPSRGRAELAGILLLLAVAAGLIATSWRRWPDPLIDFGRELYLPWAINQGAVLYRDIDANYGPLSHFLNALVFRALGTGFLQLVWANLAVYALILGLLYRASRAAAGPAGAFVGCLGFLVFFSFNQLSPVGNYNFLAPYAHETTHGFLLVLALIWQWTAWLERPGLGRSASLGFLFGLTLLLKIEIVFAAAAVSGAGFVLGAIGRGRVGWARHGLVMAVAGLVPPLVVSLMLFGTGRFTPSQAALWANVAWTGLVLFPSIAQDPIQSHFLGIDAIPENFSRLVIVGVGSAGGVLALAAICRGLGKSRDALYAVSAVGLGLGALVASLRLPWPEVGRVLPAWLAGLAVVWVIEARRRAEPPWDRPTNTRWLLWAAGAALLARMAFNPRIYHYGYCQAALAGVLTILACWREVPEMVGLRGRPRFLYLCTMSWFLAGGLWTVQGLSRSVYQAKTQPVGTGDDLFYAFDRQVEPTGALVEDARAALSAVPGPGSLFVVPEGLMINYLTRRPTPSHVYTFNPYWLKWTESVLSDLERRPPDFVLFISRDFREYGIQRFGDSPTHGGPILKWIEERYVPARHVGGDPLDVQQRGTTIFVRSPAPLPATPAAGPSGPGPGSPPPAPAG